MTHYAYFDLKDEKGRHVDEVIFHVCPHDGVIEIQCGSLKDNVTSGPLREYLIGLFGLDRIWERAGLDSSAEYWQRKMQAEASLRRAFEAERKAGA